MPIKSKKTNNKKEEKQKAMEIVEMGLFDQCCCFCCRNVWFVQDVTDMVVVET